MPRFYHSAPLPVSGSIELPYGAAHHAVRVLRLQVGETLQLFDGSGNECQGTILDISGKRVVLATSFQSTRAVSRRCKQYWASFIEQRKNDWVVQKPLSWGLAKCSRWQLSAV